MGSMAAPCKSIRCDITIQFQGSNTGRWIELQLKSGFHYMFVHIKVFRSCWRSMRSRHLELTVAIAILQGRLNSFNTGLSSPQSWLIFS
jgi:hypothetical protein